MTDVFFVSCGRQYALLWSTLFLYQHPKNEKTKPSDIKVRSSPPPQIRPLDSRNLKALNRDPLFFLQASMRWDVRTGVDASTSAVLTYPQLGAQAVVSCSLDTPTAQNSIVVTGTKGTLSTFLPLSLSFVCLSLSTLLSVVAC